MQSAASTRDEFRNAPPDRKQPPVAVQTPPTIHELTARELDQQRHLVRESLLIGAA